MKNRIDTTTSALVDRAVNLVRERGIYGAARYLHFCGVPIWVARRALTRPAASRRGANTTTAAAG